MSEHPLYSYEGENAGCKCPVLSHFTHNIVWKRSHRLHRLKNVEYKKYAGILRIYMSDLASSTEYRVRYENESNFSPILCIHLVIRRVEEKERIRIISDK